MYLHCEFGFVEADAWDGQIIPMPDHMLEVEALASIDKVIVVRSRRSDTLELLTVTLNRTPKVHPSPKNWDYEWRVYLTADEWAHCMTVVATRLDYRNFKHTAADGVRINTREKELAMAIWSAALSSNYHLKE